MAGPIEICFSRLLLITMTWRPFRARRPVGRIPGLKPWAKFFSPSGPINYPKSCLSSRHSYPIGANLLPFNAGPALNLGIWRAGRVLGLDRKFVGEVLLRRGKIELVNQVIFAGAALTEFAD